METITLEVQKREVKSRKAREQAGDNIPAVMYGNNIESQVLWVDATKFAKVIAKAGTNTIISLTVGDAKPVNVLIYDFQTDPVKDYFTHADFYVVNMKETVEAEVPLTFIGIAPAVKELGGTLIKNHDSLVVKALPANLPHEIEVDVSALKTFEDNISVSSVKVNENVEIMLDENATLVSVVAPRTEEEMADLDSEVDADVSNIEGVADKDEEGEEGTDEDSKKEETKESKE